MAKIRSEDILNVARNKQIILSRLLIHFKCIVKLAKFIFTERSVKKMQDQPTKWKRGVEMCRNTHIHQCERVGKSQEFHAQPDLDS